MVALERERERIARDLHAGAGQPLSGIHVNLDMVEEFFRAPGAENQAAAEKALQRLRHLAGEASGQVRAVSHRLHPPQWQQLPLAEALRQLIDSSGLRELFETDIRIGAVPVNLSHAAKVALYRCAQECIANVIRHSEATRVQFEAGSDGVEVGMRIMDNGRGFPAEVQGTGIGLRAMAVHAEALGGDCRIQSGAEGSTITIRIPLGPESLVEE